MWVEPVGKKREEKDYSSWFQYQEDDLAVEFIAVNLVVLHCVLLLIFCSQNKNVQLVVHQSEC